MTTDLPPWQRAPLLVLGFAGLISGVLAGLWRMGWPMPAFAAGAPHGVLMMCAFFGTLIALERAVAIGRRWAYLGPLAGGVGGVMLIAGADARFAFVAFVVAGVVLVAASLHAQRIQNALHAKVLTLGATAWLTGVLVWGATGDVIHAQRWWLAFLIITIAGERLELSRLMRITPAMTRAFVAILAVLIGATMLSAFEIGQRLSGVALVALALWLLRQDVARRTVRGTALVRFIAVCLLTGYLWLALGGVLLATLAPAPGHAGWDAALHALSLGFVFSMVFGHAPIILPAVLRVKLPYHASFYLPLALLHASLALRAGGDLAGHFAARASGGLGNAVAIALFLVLQISRVAGARRSPH